MHPSLVILEQVVQMTEEEFELVELEDAAGLEESAKKRNELLKEAWSIKDGCNELYFVELLLTIQRLQHEVSQLAQNRFAETREALNSQKKSRKAVRGYCQTGIGYTKRPPKIFAKFS